MVSRYVVRADAALPERMKTTVLSQEVLRRERNTSQNVDRSVRTKIRNRFMMKLRVSGYGVRQRLNIMLSGLKGYKYMVEEEARGGRKINRARVDGAKTRRIRKVLGKTNWFRSKRKSPKYSRLRGGCTRAPPTTTELKDLGRKSRKTENRETEAVLFVPCMRGGILQRMIQDAEDKFVEGTKRKGIKVIERGGTKLKDLLSSNQHSKKRCDRRGCLPCKM